MTDESRSPRTPKGYVVDPSREGAAVGTSISGAGVMEVGGELRVVLEIGDPPKLIVVLDDDDLSAIAQLRDERARLMS